MIIFNWAATKSPPLSPLGAPHRGRAENLEATSERVGKVGHDGELAGMATRRQSAGDGLLKRRSEGHGRRDGGGAF